MLTHTEHVAVCILLEDAYIEGAVVLLKSLLANNEWYEGDLVVLEYGSLSRANRERLSRIYQRIVFKRVRVEDYGSTRFQIRSPTARQWHRSPGAYNPAYRFDLFLLGEYDRVVYFDVDMVVVGDLRPLFSELQPDFGACRLGPSAGRGDGRKEGFNGGLLSVSRRYLTSEVRQELIALASCPRRGPWSGNQPILNQRFFDNGQCELLPATYNVYTEGTVDKVAWSAARVLHFVGEAKPWSSMRRFSPHQIHAAGVERCRRFLQSWFRYSDLPLPLDPLFALEEAPLITVVVILRDGPEDALACLISVQDQTYPNWECVVVSPPGCDATRHAVEPLVASEPVRFRLVRASSASLAAATNLGIDRARGVQIVPLESDRSLRPTAIEELWRVCCRDPYVSLIATNCRCETEQGTLYRDPPRLAELGLLDAELFTSLFPKALWESLGGYKPCMVLGGVGWEFWLHAHKRGHDGRRVVDPLVSQRAPSTTRRSEDRRRGLIRSQLRLLHPQLFPARDQERAAAALAREPSFVAALTEIAETADDDDDARRCLVLLSAAAQQLSWRATSTAPASLSVLVDCRAADARPLEALDALAVQTLPPTAIDVTVLSLAPRPAASGRWPFEVRWIVLDEEDLAPRVSDWVHDSHGDLIAVLSGATCAAPSFLEACLARHHAARSPRMVLLFDEPVAEHLLTSPYHHWIVRRGIEEQHALAGCREALLFHGGARCFRRELLLEHPLDRRFLGAEWTEWQVRVDVSLEIEPGPLVARIALPEPRALFESAYLTAHGEHRLAEEHPHLLVERRCGGVPLAVAQEVTSALERLMPRVLSAIDRLTREGDQLDVLTRRPSYPQATERDVSFGDGELRCESEQARLFETCLRYTRARAFVDADEEVAPAIGLARLRRVLRVDPRWSTPAALVGPPPTVRRSAAAPRALLLTGALPSDGVARYSRTARAARRLVTLMHAEGFSVDVLWSTSFPDQSVDLAFQDRRIDVRDLSRLERDLDVRLYVHQGDDAGAELARIATLRDPRLIIACGNEAAPWLDGHRLDAEKVLLASLDEHYEQHALDHLRRFKVVDDPFLRLDFYADVPPPLSLARRLVAHGFDRYLAFTDEETALLREAGAAIVGTLPFAPSARQSSHLGPPLMVMGAHVLNLQAYQLLTRRVLPLVLAREPAFELAVAGVWSVPPSPGVRLLGELPDLEAAYAQAAFAVCPQLASVGIPWKVAEAMANGLAVVAFATAVRSSSGGDDGVFLARDAEELAAHVLRLSSDRELCRRAGAAARAAAGVRDLHRGAIVGDAGGQHRSAALISSPPTVRQTAAVTPPTARSAS
jgi:lipopolysaccharide biosynthesis glycosyltransferase/glycosyltransferase involved in cell wall biosynthesis